MQANNRWIECPSTSQTQSMITPNVVLQYENTDSGRTYFLHCASTFPGPDYIPAGFSVVQVPAIVGGILIVVLDVQAVSDGINPVVHEVPIGTFPQQIASWKLQLTVVDQNETLVGQGSELQDKDEAQER